jgi:hypothetical protein
MTRLIVIGARSTGTSLALVRAALDRQLDVTVISGPNDSLQGVFAPQVELVNLQTDAEVVVAWLRRHYPDPERRLRVTTANDVYARLAAQVAETPGAARAGRGERGALRLQGLSEVAAGQP